jgi:hypothetical protein
VKLWLGFLALCFVVSACGSSTVRPAPQSPPRSHPIARLLPSPTALRFSTASNRAFALRDVRRLLRRVVVPARAQVLTKAPKGEWSRELENTLRHHGTTLTTANAGRAWLIWGPLARVSDEVEVKGGYPDVTAHCGCYDFSGIPGRVVSRSITLDIYRFAGYHGPTFVLANAQETYVRVPPRSALLPSRIKRIDVTSRYGTGPNSVLVHVTSPFKIASVVSRMNGLGLRRPISWCEGYDGGEPVVRLTFRSASGSVLARVREVEGFDSNDYDCSNRVRLTIGTQSPVLLNGSDLLDRLGTLLGVDLDPASPSAVSGCLQREGWVVHTHHDRPVRLVAVRHGRTWTITFPLNRKPTANRPLPQAAANCVIDPGWNVLVYTNASYP